MNKEKFLEYIDRNIKTAQKNAKLFDTEEFRAGYITCFNEIKDLVIRKEFDEEVEK